MIGVTTPAAAEVRSADTSHFSLTLPGNIATTTLAPARACAIAAAGSCSIDDTFVSTKLHRGAPGADKEARRAAQSSSAKTELLGPSAASVDCEKQIPTLMGEMIREVEITPLVLGSGACALSGSDSLCKNFVLASSGANIL